MYTVKIEKWLIDGDSNLSPWEKFERKLIVNWQIADLIDRDAENQCDSVDFVHECMQNFVRNISCSWQEVQQRLHCLHSEGCWHQHHHKESIQLHRIADGR